MSKLFPELDLPDVSGAPESVSGAPESPTPAAPRPITTAQASPPQAGLGGKEALTRALAIPTRSGHRPAQVRTFEVFAKEGRALVEIQGGGWPEVAFFIVRRGTANGVAEGEFLTLVGRGQNTDPFVTRIIQHCAMRLRRTTWDSLVRAALRDQAGVEDHGLPPEEGMPMPGMVWPPNDVDVEYLNSLGFGYSPDGAWRNFLVGHENNYGGIENSRGYCQKVNGKIAGVSHTEIECRMSAPVSGNGSLTFWNHVQPDTAGVLASKPDEWIELFSDLTEIDVIKGGHTKLDRMLDALVESGEEPDVVVLTQTCTTTVIGDDTVGAVEKMKRKKPLRVVNMAETRDVTATLFEQSKIKPGFMTTPKVPGSINLMGLPKLVGQVHLLEMLRDAGVQVSSWVLPDLRSAEVDRFMAAEVTVLYDWGSLDHAYNGMLRGLPLKLVRPPPPVGISGTHAWWTMVGDALGARDRFDRVWEEHYGRHAPAWTALRRRARGYRLGFIGEERLLGRYLSSRQLFGFHLLELLEEMGFGIDLHLVPAGGRPRSPRVEDATADSDIPAPFRPSNAETARRRVIWTTTADELEQDLANAEAVAFYSEIFFDRRLTRTGRNIFSVREFGRLGLEGAVDALRRMLRVCEMPFFRTYAPYFGSPFAIGPGK